MNAPEQGTDEWFLAHRGLITGRNIQRVVRGTPKGWLTLIGQMRAELESDVPIRNELFVDPVLRGRELEPEALANAELMLGEEIKKTGLLRHPHIDYLGCSPDGLLTERGWPIEVKCYTSRDKHLQVLSYRVVPDEHICQVHLEIDVCDTPAGLFVSYCPEMPHWKQRTAIVEVPRDEGFISRMQERCRQFMAVFNGEQPPIRHHNEIPQLF